MEKIVNIDGREMRMRASARTPRLYRFLIGRDMIADMRKLQKAYAKTQEGENFDALDLTIFENAAWIMLKQGGEDVGNSPDEWLDTIDGVFDVYKVMPTLISLWQENNATTAIPKKG